MVYRLNVPYSEKDEAKSLGAKWYASEKYWYYKGDSLPQGLKRWYREENGKESRGIGSDVLTFGGSDDIGKNGNSGVYDQGVSVDSDRYIRLDSDESKIIDTETGEIIEVYTLNGRIPSGGDIPFGGETPFGHLESNNNRSKYYTSDIFLSQNENDRNQYANYRTVSEVNTMISEIVYATNEFRSILVKGEVTNFDGKKGRHYYFAIKDEWALLPCVMWDHTAAYALNFKLEKGQQVALSGSLEFYKEGGRAQLIVSGIENIGEGQANLALIKLKAKLEAEGLFAPERKKPIPKHPAQVGIITSKNGQAIKDICKVANKRNPYVQLVLYHVNVQGVNAVGTIVEGIKALDSMGLDTIIVGRGGGSDEELNVYNDERIARTVSEAVTPIVSAVGHQGHWTLIDYVADKRAATPSEAAEETIPDIMTDIKRVELLLKGISDNMASILKGRRLLIDAKLSELEKNSPQMKLKEKTDRLTHLAEMMEINIRNRYSSCKDRVNTLSEAITGNMKLIYAGYRDKPQNLLDSINSNMQLIYQRYSKRFEVLLAELNGLSPTAKLVGGFGYVTRDEKPVKSASSVKPGDAINIRMHDGDIGAVVK